MQWLDNMCRACYVRKDGTAGAGGAVLAAVNTATPQAFHSRVLTYLQACYGHTEGTAGVTGALLAAGALQRHMAPAITNLRGVNPYVEAAAADWRRGGGRAAVLPRQTGPTVASTVRMQQKSCLVT